MTVKTSVRVAALLLSTGCWMPQSVLAQGQYPFLGEIETFAFNFCPLGWLAADGSVLPITQYTALFSLLGTTYGGNGINNFALPKWGPIYSANGGTFTVCIAVTGVFPSHP